MHPPDQSAHAVALNTFCPVEQEKLEALVMLLNELLPLVSIPTKEHLQGVFVVPDDQRETLINELTKELDELAGAYVAGIHSRASAVPMEVSTEDGNALVCIVFLAESLVQEINPKHYHSADLISTLLEELFHVRHYSTIWQRRGYFHPRHIDLACRKDLFTLCSNFQDEYVAIRWKASVAASIPLVEIPDGGRTVVYLRYGLSIAPLLDLAATNLSRIISDAVSKKLSVGDAWPKLLQVVYREIFEPLAREAAFQAAIPTDADIPHPPRDASESWFYRQGVAPYWDQVRIQLERSFNKNLEKEDTALNNMVDIHEAFLREMGVTCYKIPSGDSYILFRSLS